MPLVWLLALLPTAAPPASQDELPPALDRPVDYATEVAPLLEKHCFACHGPQKHKSGLRLDDPAAAHEGGDLFGPAIIAGQSAESPLLRLAAGLEQGMIMPPRKDDAPTLSAAELSLLRTWIDRGAETPGIEKKSPASPANSLWSLQPLARPPVPPIAPGSRARNPIDAFLDLNLASRSVSPAPEADRPTLLRRLSFDLTGLPPTPDDISHFLADDTPDAYDRAVERLLASPRLGERWARHWLDVVHYGESNGFGMDRPRLNAWPYRDYVIDSFNRDRPYAEFVQQQIAADALYPGEPSATAALGFAAAGPFNQSALVEQVDGTQCKLIALNLDRDDMVANFASTFLSLTVHCARCHDHKFDPIPQVDYYRLQSVFAGVGRTERTFDVEPSKHAERLELSSFLKALDENKPIPDLSTSESERLNADRQRWESETAAQLAAWHTSPASSAESTGESVLELQPDGSYLAKGASPDTDSYSLWFPSPPPNSRALRLELLTDDTLPAKGPGRADNGNLHLTGLAVAVTDAAGNSTPVALTNPSSDFDQADWTIAHALDSNPATGWGIHPQEGKPHAAVVRFASPITLTDGQRLRVTLEQAHGRRHTIGRFRLAFTDSESAGLAPALPADVLAALQTPAPSRTPAQSDALVRHYLRRDVSRRLSSLGDPRKVWAIASDFPARRNYKPSVPPVPIHVLRRGDVMQPKDPVAPGALSALRAPEFDLSADAPDSARRAALARWATSPDNPIVWRSIANRLWHWHFGRGLVDSPNDFGHMGGTPSHPELLDWLACEVRDGASLRDIHRLIVTSAAYRRSSDAPNPPGDDDNRWLSRRSRQRLDAEQLRDTLVLLAGRLDSTMGGPSAMQFTFKDPNVEVSPGVDYASFDPDDPAGRRRSVYRFLFRNVNDPLLEAFDVADPSLSTPRRDVTITPQQALALWNDRLVLRTCEHLAAVLDQQEPDLSARIDRACLAAWGRPPRDQERTSLIDHAQRHGLASACRIILNSNDFLFIH